MTRLSTNIKESLWRKLCERSFRKETQQLINLNAAHANRVWEASFSQKDRDLMASLPEGWLPTDHDIQIQFAGRIQTIYFWGTLGQYSLPENLRHTGAVLKDAFRRFPSKKKDGVCAVFDRGHPLCEEFDALQEKLTALAGRVGDARRAAFVVMNSASTVKRLIAIWPEAEEFAKKYLDNGERKALLPAVSVERLNALLGLPPENAK